MFTAQNNVNEIVLKTAAYQRASGSDPLASLPRPRTEFQACGSPSHLFGSSLSGVHRAPQDPPAHVSPSFTFHVPVGGTSPQNAIPAHPQHVDAAEEQRVYFTARTALEAALQRHEEALRSWADAPLRQLPLRPPSALPRPSTSPATLTKAAATTTALATTTAAAAAAAVASPSPATLSVVKPYCRVRASGSMASIGLPQRGHMEDRISKRDDPPQPLQHTTPTEASRLTKGTNDTAATTSMDTTDTGTRISSHEASSVDGGYVASRSSLSDTARASPDEAVTRLKPSTAAGAAATVGTPLAPYQLPLRMRWDVSMPPLTTTTTVGSTGAGTVGRSPEGRDSGKEEDGRQTFLREQAARYAHWRHRQLQILHQLAPDMWGRALPPYAALDRTPQVMDGGLHYCASTVRQLQCDSGVVYV